jgi:phage gp37-like protein
LASLIGQGREMAERCQRGEVASLEAGLNRHRTGDPQSFRAQSLLAHLQTKCRNLMAKLENVLGRSFRPLPIDPGDMNTFS